MVTPEAGKVLVAVNEEELLRSMTGASHCSVTVPLPTSEGIMSCLTAIALMSTPLTFSRKGKV